MSHRGRDNNYNWGRGRDNRVPRPPGLRGREIGLYFSRRQLRKEGKEPKDYCIHFAIPPAVATGIENNIKSIKELANSYKIPILKFNGLNFVGKQKKEEPKNEYDFSLDVDICSSNAPEISSPSNVASQKNISVSSPSTSKYYTIEGSNDVKPEIIENIKTEPMEEDTDNNTQLTKPIENTGDNTLQPNIVDNIKKEPTQAFSHGSNLNETIQPETEPTDVKDSNMIETKDTSNETLLSLRGGGDYKYGYKDIITGSFDEKLDKCLARGIAIIKNSTETDNLNAALYQDYRDMLDMNNYQKYMKFRETLPTFKKSEQLLEVIKNNQVVVISGETGCGKSTQIPQLILDDAITHLWGGYVKILVTQPRRIAASSLAMRVARERAEVMGGAVGYAVRLEKIEARARGSIMFCTTGILLSTLEVDQALSNYSHVILDEVHERDCDIDLAMFMLKKVLRKRKDLKLLLMSATLDADKLSAYFDNCPMVHIEGLAYPVKDIYLEEILEIIDFKLHPIKESEKNVKPWHKYKKKKLANDMEKDIQYKAEISSWLESMQAAEPLKYSVYKTLLDSRIEELNMDLICQLLMHICRGPPGAILVFLPGIGEISKLLRTMQESRQFPSSLYEIWPLHSKLPSIQQHQIFEKPPGNIRKIIVATNIAETSITIDDIVYVIDSGKIKYSGLNVEENVSTLQTEWVSQANLRQRRGRAGRCQPGICYHLLTSYRASKLEERLLPEIQRNPLLEPVLSIKRLRLGKAADALQLMPAPPAERTIKLAVSHLQQCGALDFAEKLTPLGWHLARLPVHPAAGKLLILGALFGCLNRAASVAAVWGFKDPFQIVIGKEDLVDAAKIKFALGEGSDQVAISEAIIQWEQQSTRSNRLGFAYSNFLANNTLELLSDMKTQLGNNLKAMGFLPSGDILSPWENRNTDNLSLFKAVVAAALYPNVATTKWTHPYNVNKAPTVKARTAEDGFVFIHPSSVLAGNRHKRTSLPSPKACKKTGANWLVYWNKQRSSELYVLEVTLVHTLPLLFFGELTVTEAEKPDECYINITSIKVRCNTRTAELLFQMKLLLDQVLASKIGVSTNHIKMQNPFEDRVLNAVMELITAEDERALHLDDDPLEYDSSAIESTSSGRR